MSHDAWMEVTRHKVTTEVCDIGNYTRNVSPMWWKAMTHAAGREMAIQHTDGMTGAEALPLFLGALGHMFLHPSEYRALEPANGWGDYKGARDFVLKCAEACEDYPGATIRWSV